MSLPDSWVDRIFTKLTNVYGHQFLSRWDGIDLVEVKADWAHELRGFAQNPGAIAYGLEHLPAGKAPTVIEFRAICNSPSAPRPETPLQLPNLLKRADEGARTLERLQRVCAANPDCGGVAWALALELKDREEPHNVSPTVREMYREALAHGRRTYPAEAA